MPQIPTFRAGFALPLEELREEFDRLWTTLTAAPPLHGWGVRPEAGFPAVNVRESDEAIMVEAELPGLEAADVGISVTGNELVLEGSRPTGPGAGGSGNGEQAGEQAGEQVIWHRRERGTGGFKRRIPLPLAVDADRVEARLVDGVLTVTCPKAAECQPRRVEVRSA
jgi:HSP20 family protein